MLPRSDSDHPLDKIRFGLMVAIGGADSTETLAIIGEQQRTVAAEREEIPKRAAALGDEFLASADAQLQALLQKLDDYSNWLQKCRTALETSDTAAAMELHEQSQDLLPELTKTLADYNRAYAQFGPFETALSNTLWRLCEGMGKGEVVKATWDQYGSYYQKELTAKLETLAQLDLPGRTSLLDDYVETLKIVTALAKDGEPTLESLRPHLTSIDQHLKPAQALEQVMAESHENGPTKIPATNVLLAVLKHPRGQLADQMLLSVLDDYNEIVEGYLATFEQAVARPTHSDLIKEEIPRTLDTIDDHFMLLEDLNDVLEEGDTKAVQELMSKVTESANKLVESREVYEVAAQHQSHKACPSCARSNPPENEYCEACGELLPREDKTGRSASSTFSLMSGPISEETRQAEMTENVARLFQSCDDIHDGKITKQQFKDELSTAAEALKEFIEEYENQVNLALDESQFSPEEWENWRTNHLPPLEDLAISYYAGIEDLRQGLTSMQAYLSDPNQEHLVLGIKHYWQGIQAIHRGKLGIRSHHKLLEDLFKESERTM